jgi:hypothetical protein
MVGPPLRVLPRVVPSGSAVRLVAGSPYAYRPGRPATRSGAPFGPPNARQRESIQSSLLYAPAGISRKSVKVYFCLLSAFRNQKSSIVTSGQTRRKLKVHSWDYVDDRTGGGGTERATGSQPTVRGTKVLRGGSTFAGRQWHVNHEAACCYLAGLQIRLTFTTAPFLLKTARYGPAK